MAITGVRVSQCATKEKVGFSHKKQERNKFFAVQVVTAEWEIVSL